MKSVLLMSMSLILISASSAFAKVDDFNSLIEDNSATQAEAQEQIQSRSIQSENTTQPSTLDDKQMPDLNRTTKADMQRHIVVSHRPEDLQF